jgi:hypothetical protein
VIVLCPAATPVALRRMTFYAMQPVNPIINGLMFLEAINKKKS